VKGDPVERVLKELGYTNTNMVTQYDDLHGRQGGATTPRYYNWHMRMWMSEAEPKQQPRDVSGQKQRNGLNHLYWTPTKHE